MCNLPHGYSFSVSGFINFDEAFQLADIYCRCFRGWPWFETWTRKAAYEEIVRYRNPTYLVVRDEFLMVVAGEILIPIEEHQDFKIMDKQRGFRGSLWLSDVFVDPNHQGKGLGKYLASKAVEVAKGIRMSLTSRTLKVDDESEYRMPRIFKSCGLHPQCEATFTTGDTQSVRILYRTQYSN